MNCDICGKEKPDYKLHDYDIKNFPEFKNKSVCEDCRTIRYLRSLNDIQKEIDDDNRKEVLKMKDKGYTHKYSFVVHGTGGDKVLYAYSKGELKQEQINIQCQKLKRKHKATRVDYAHVVI